MRDILTYVSALNVRVHYQAAKAAFKRAATEDGLAFDDGKFQVTGDNTKVQPYVVGNEDAGSSWQMTTTVDICGFIYDYSTYVMPDGEMKGSA